MKNGILKTLLALVAVFVCASAFAQRPERPKWEDLRYEDIHTFKLQTSFPRDPWTWAYTKEFAERFRMPEKWIEPELAGVLAISFRVTTLGQSTTCGLGGQESNCWVTPACHLDIYYDNRIKLPLIPEIQVRDNLLWGISSTTYLFLSQDPPQFHAKYNALPSYASPTGRRGPNGSDNGIILMSIGFDNEEGRSRQSPEIIHYYDRDYSLGIGLIGISLGACPSYPIHKGSHWLDFYANQEAQAKAKWHEGYAMKKEAEAKAKAEMLSRTQLKAQGLLVHEAYIPESFLVRARKAAEEGGKENQQTIERLIREFKQRKP
jgi:hypothetical protein